MAAAVVGTVPSYPVHVGARTTPDHLSRWLWLVKWALVIPHVLVLALLWAAFVVLSVVALVAILATGRYPRAIFDFNVGVLRWSWRVAYYSYGALGTDRYPPFSLRADTDYPAHLEVDYPERLSRGLVLVKWWLLVLPHYLVLVLLLGAGARVAREVSGLPWVWEGGLIAVLGLLAGLSLLLTGRYPRGLYDLVLGLNRWVLRVAAYAGLLTDAYPPFRLDQGGPDAVAFSSGAPGAGAPTTALPPSPDALHAGTRTGAGPGTAPAPGPGPTSSWTAGPVTGLVLGALAVLVGLTGVVGGGALLAGNAWMREDGFLTSPSRQVDSPGYAVVSGEVLLAGAWLDEGLGDVRLRAVGLDGDVFLGVATTDDAAAYLDGVGRTVLTGARSGREIAGGPPAVPPEDAGIWAASTFGPGLRTLDLAPRPGRWVAVLMPTDGGPGVAATVDAGATVPWMTTAAAAALLVGIALVGAGAGGMVLAVRAATPSPARPPEDVGRRSGP